MPNSSKPSTMAASAARGAGSSSTENRLPEPVKSRCEDRVVGVAGQGRVDHLRAPPAGPRASWRARAPAPGAPSCGSPACAGRAPRGSSRRARRRCPSSRWVSLEPRPGRVVGRGRAEHRVRMADEHLGAGVDHDVGAQRQRLVKERRRPGIVDDDRDVARLAPAATIAGRSCTSKVSEPGLSTKIALVLSVISAAMPAPMRGS